MSSSQVAVALDVQARDCVSNQRRRGMDLYRSFVQDPGFWCNAWGVESSVERQGLRQPGSLGGITHTRDGYGIWDMGHGIWVGEHR